MSPPVRGGRAPAPRITLREPDPGGMASLRPWFAAGWLDVRGLGAQSAHEAPTPEDWLAAAAVGETSLLITLDAAVVGYLRCRLSDPDCGITELAVRPDVRNLGYGSEAVFALEALAATAGGRQGVALVPRANGLAIYFWLRIGYRPAYPRPAPLPGFTAMVRDLANEAHRGARGSGSRIGGRRSGGRARSPAPAPRRSR